jgi:hypothetical protein
MQRRLLGSLVSNELGKMSKKLSWPNLGFYSGNYLEGLRKIIKPLVTIPCLRVEILTLISQIRIRRAHSTVKFGRTVVKSHDSKRYRLKEKNSAILANIIKIQAYF